MCWEKPSLSALGLREQDFPTLTSATAVVIGTAGECKYRCLPCNYQCFWFSGSGPWLSKQCGLALLKSLAKFLHCPSHCCHCSWQLSRCTGKSLSPLAPREVCNNSSELENCFLFITVGWKAQVNQHKCSPQSEHFNWPLSGGSLKEGCSSPDSSRMNPSHKVYSISSKSGNFCPCPAQSTDKAMYICCVYSAEDADWH